MKSADFEKIWNLYQTLFPGHHNLRNENTRIVWEVALRPYALGDVVEASMDWARRSKYFPNIAEITAGLTQVESPLEKQERAKDRYGDVAWMAPHIHKVAARLTDAEAEEIHAAGLLTWREVEAAGMDFAEWNRDYRRKFPVGSGREWES